MGELVFTLYLVLMLDNVEGWFCQVDQEGSGFLCWYLFSLSSYLFQTKPKHGGLVVSGGFHGDKGPAGWSHQGAISSCFSTSFVQ